MTQLPEPLPYDYVDELIDTNFKFKYHVYNQKQRDGTKIEVARWLCWPNGRRRTQVSRPFISMETDFNIKDNFDAEYITWGGSGGAMYWTDEEMNDDDIDAYLEVYIGGGELE